MAEDTQILKCIVLTLKSDHIIVPNAAIAEIIKVNNLGAVEDSPPWMMGYVSWRGFDVPLVSYEIVGGADPKVLGTVNQAAILYSIRPDHSDSYPYMGLVTSGVPHVTRFTSEQITSATSKSKKLHPLVMQKVKVNGAAMNIFDVDAMEKMLQEQLK